MGKRIPGKKHRGVKDPSLQKALREEVLKNKINAPPKDIDCQEIPKSVERIMELKKLAKEGKFDTPKKKLKRRKNRLMDTSKFIIKERNLPGVSKADRDLPTLVQKPNEGDQEFLSRVCRTTDTFIKEVKFEAKHNLKMKRDEKTGKINFDKVELHPVDKMFQDKLEASKKHKHKKQTNESDKMLSKTAKRRLRLQAKKEKLRQLEGEIGNEDEFAILTDKVQFNEVVHRPPSLTALPRKAPALDEIRKPGKKPGLLLSQFFSTQPQNEPRRDLTVRRKALSLSDRRRLDVAQAEAIQAYRQLRAVRSSAKT